MQHGKFSALYFRQICFCIVFVSMSMIIMSMSYWTGYFMKNNQPVKFYDNIGFVTKVRRQPDGREKLAALLDAVQPELEEKLKNATEKKIILIYHAMFGVTSPYKVNPAVCGNCEITYDKKQITNEKTAAVVFHFHAINRNSMPATRNPEQLHIFWDLEAPPALLNLRGMTLDFEDSYKFNATMNYRRDSDFVMFYGFLNQVMQTVSENKNGVYTTANLIQLKSKKGVAVISNCGGTPGARVRLKMIKEIMATGFGLEPFGACFKQNGKFAEGASRGTDKFNDAVRKYKFYFSFENSHYCRDYITEKFFVNALLPPALPVVWGAKREDYEGMAPPGSFVYVEDYGSIPELVKYLNYLDKNDTAYLEYFRWYSKIPPDHGRQTNFCQICRAVHGINVDDVFDPNYNFTHPIRPLFTNGTATRIIPSLKQWFYGTENKECFEK